MVFDRLIVFFSFLWNRYLILVSNYKRTLSFLFLFVQFYRLLSSANFLHLLLSFILLVVIICFLVLLPIKEEKKPVFILDPEGNFRGIN